MTTGFKVCTNCPHAKRSKEHHSLLFHICAAAYENWPVTEEFQPTSVENLRAWTLVEIGWKEEFEVDLHDAFDVMLAAHLPAATQMRLITLISSNLMGRAKAMMDKPPIKMFTRGKKIVLVAPKSISKAKCTTEDYTRVCDRFVSELAFRTGTTVELLKQVGASRIEKKRAAA